MYLVGYIFIVMDDGKIFVVEKYTTTRGINTTDKLEANNMLL